jgi:hypothetical protein
MYLNIYLYKIYKLKIINLSSLIILLIRRRKKKIHTNTHKNARTHTKIFNTQFIYSASK